MKYLLLFVFLTGCNIISLDESNWVCSKMKAVTQTIYKEGAKIEVPTFTKGYQCTQWTKK